MAEVRQRSLARHIVTTGAVSGVIAILNFASGVVVARWLGDDGRGQVGFLLVFAQTIGWIGALGMNEGVTYAAAKQLAPARRIASTAALLMLVLGTLGLVVAQLLLPVLTSSQPRFPLALAQVFLFAIYLQVGSGLLMAALAGCQDFGGRNVALFLQPATYVAIVLVLALTGNLGVGSVLAATAISSGVALGYAAFRIRSTIGFARPSMAVSKQAALFGLKLQGALLGSMGNTRLAMVIAPTVLSFSAIGLYSVATGVSSILVAVVGVMGSVVMPATTRLGGRKGAEFVARMVRTMTVAALCVALPLFVLAPWLLPFVYGEQFRGAALLLRILLPGVVLTIASGLLESGLQAVNRPISASICQLTGLAVTIVGLTLTLEPYGIVGAAGTTVAAALATFLCAVFMIRQQPEFRLREMVSIRGLRDDARFAAGRVQELVRKRTGGNRAPQTTP